MIKIIIQVFPGKKNLPELKTIKYYLKWQGIPYSIQETPDVLKNSMGRSHICSMVYSDKNPVPVFYTFHQLYNWVEKNGLHRI